MGPAAPLFELATEQLEPGRRLSVVVPLLFPPPLSPGHHRRPASAPAFASVPPAVGRVRCRDTRDRRSGRSSSASKDPRARSRRRPRAAAPRRREQHRHDGTPRPTPAPPRACDRTSAAGTPSPRLSVPPRSNHSTIERRSASEKYPSNTVDTALRTTSRATKSAPFSSPSYSSSNLPIIDGRAA